MNDAQRALNDSLGSEEVGGSRGHPITGSLKQPRQVPDHVLRLSPEVIARTVAEARMDHFTESIPERVYEKALTHVHDVLDAIAALDGEA